MNADRIYLMPVRRRASHAIHALSETLNRSGRREAGEHLTRNAYVRNLRRREHPPVVNRDRTETRDRCASHTALVPQKRDKSCKLLRNDPDSIAARTYRARDVRGCLYSLAMSMRCPTTRAPISSKAEAIVIAQRAHKPTNVVRCHYCGWWHVVGAGSALERPSKPRRRK